MELTEYKGYKIEVETNGLFKASEVQGFYSTFTELTTKLDAIIRSERKEGFPIEVISSGMKRGKITSYNAEERQVWFSRDNVNPNSLEIKRSKEGITNNSRKPNFYKPTEHNLALVKRYQEISDAMGKLNTEARQLEQSLTDPITFD